MQFRDARYLLLLAITVLTLTTIRLTNCRALRAANPHFRSVATDEDEEEQSDVEQENVLRTGQSVVFESGNTLQSESENDHRLSLEFENSNSQQLLESKNGKQNLESVFEVGEHKYEKDVLNVKSELDKEGKNRKLQFENDLRNLRSQSEIDNWIDSSWKTYTNDDTKQNELGRTGNHVTRQSNSDDNVVAQSHEIEEHIYNSVHESFASTRAVSQSHLPGQDKAATLDTSEHDVGEVEGRDSILSGDVYRNGTTAPNSVKPPGRHVPKYMLDLYNANLDAARDSDSKANNDYWFKNADTVKGFINANGAVYRTYDDLDNSAEARRGTQTRIHTLVFHVTEMNPNESLDYAELRLYALITRDQRTFLGVDRLVTIILVSSDEPKSGYVVLDSRHVYEKSNAWERFNVTAAVLLWTDPKNSEMEQRLEIRIDSIFSSAAGGIGHMDITTRPYKATEPLLLVFSSDPRKRKQREETGTGSGTGKNKTEGHRERRAAVELTEEEEEEETNMIIADVSGRRHKKKRHRNPCRRKPLTVDFSVINYDTWILAPREYEAFECSGKCYFPLSDHLSPTQHAIIQTLLHTMAPKRAPRACCVPTKLGSISILYLDKDGVATYKYRHDDMVVTECGCR